jgi:hypothetical protein
MRKSNLRRIGLSHCAAGQATDLPLSWKGGAAAELLDAPDA